MAEETRVRRPGDRKEGRRVRSLEAFNYFIPYIMPTRNDACNQFAGTVEITDVDKWLRQQRINGYKGMGMLHLFIAAYVRVCSQYPAINRFIEGRRIYSRDDNIKVSMTVKRELTIEGAETTIKVNFSPTDTVYDVYEKMNAAIDEIKANDGPNNTESVAGVLCSLPRFLLRFAVFIIRILDYMDWLPRFLINASPFHASMFITDMGSLGIPPIYHHLYNFGNIPVFISFGRKYKKAEIDAKAKTVVEKKYIDFKVVCDERTCDGMTYATAFRYVDHYLTHPEVLAVPPEKVMEDVR